MAGVADIINSYSPSAYLPLQEDIGSTLPVSTPTITTSLVGSPLPAQSGPYGDKAWSVNGAGGSYVQLADSALTKFSGGAFSVLCAVYLNTVVSFATAVGKTPSSGGGTHEYLIRLNGTSGWQFWLSQNGNGNGYASASSVVAPSTGVWTWLLGTWSGTGTTDIYVNGVLGGTSVATSGFPSAGIGTGARIGDYQGTGISGRVAHVAWWPSRLTADQALAIYQASARASVVIG